MTPIETHRLRAIGLAACAAGLGAVALVLASDRPSDNTVWAIIGPAVGWSFVGTGRAAARCEVPVKW